MRKLLKNKKGQLPVTDVLGNILNAIRSFISWFLNIAPKPLLILFFLAFILLIGNFLMPLIVNGLGFHCDTSGTVWKISGTALFTNFGLIMNKPDLEEADLQNIPVICGSTGKMREMVICTNCTINTSQDVILAGCAGDGYRLDDYKFFRAFLCEWLGCAPPVGYFYNYTEDKYQCYESHCINKTLDDYNNRLYSVESATPVYGESIEGNYSVFRMIYFKCQQRNPINIRLTFFGIDVFDYKIWVALFVIGGMLIFMSQYQK